MKCCHFFWCSQGIKELAKACVSRENLCCIHCCNLMANLEFMIVHCTNYPRVLLCVKWRNMPTHQQVDHRNAFSLWQVGWRMVLQQVSGCGLLGLMMTLMVVVDHDFRRWQEWRFFPSTVNRGLTESTFIGRWNRAFAGDTSSWKDEVASIYL